MTAVEDESDAAVPRVVEEYGSTLEVFELPCDEDTLLAVLTELFENWWDEIFFGTLVEGGAWEVAAPNAPERLSMFDGYLTVDFGRWHFHLCIGEHTASGPELGRIRRCSEAYLYRTIGGDGSPVSWGLRLLNGEGTQIGTVLLPNPFLSNRQAALPEPDWSRLVCWDLLRERFLGLGPDPRDRTGAGFAHG
ncbi:MAG: hypothetical protein AAGD33_12595 [Actinomycetota bacterium]